MNAIIQKCILSGVFLAVAFTACQKPAVDDATDPTELSSFQLLQKRVLTPSCATTGCHASEQDNMFSQHGLVLAEGVAYKNLIEVAPRNTSAKEDGLLRVKPFNSLQSLLYHKLNFDNSHHGGKSYGSPMPLGRDPLSVGQIEFVRRWIEAGAPREGNVVDEKLLDDKTPSVSASFEPLPVPTAGQGFQMTLAPFDVAPNFERELFVRKPVGNTEEIFVNRFQVKMRNSSHHFVAYNFRNNQLLPTLNEIRDLRNPDNSVNLATVLSMQNHVYFAGSQTPTADYTFPEGTALRIPANATIDLNSHYVNKTAAPIKGEVYFNLFTVDKAKVQRVVQTLDWGNTSLNIPAKSKVTLSKTFTVDKPVKVLVLTSHTHKLGEKFIIRIKGGARNNEIVYESTDWEHPETITYKTPISLNKGEGLTSEITYNNTTSQAVRFGLTSEDEMGIIFGYYYEE
ncbi:hypothetical protein GCM10023189_33820 [Nibrella saemangeumensis]|uniref:Copper type II ascorbate-dependent monooxygenase C-terminal domain-containing protein n=1 Tax=Nibrella saemangeumensis TaxID=1084526 RepID=A0ABP8N5Q2_9BACT